MSSASVSACIRNPVDFGVLGLDPYIFRHAAAEILEKAVHFMGLAHPVPSVAAESALAAGSDLVHSDPFAQLIALHVVAQAGDSA